MLFEIDDNSIRCIIPFDEGVLGDLKNENVGNNVGLNVGLNVGNISLNKTEKKVIICS